MTYSLKGVRILNTRPKEQAQLLSTQIKEAGGVVIEFPTVEIQLNTTEWIHSLPPLTQIQHALFISANAVTYCFTQLDKQHILWPKHINVVAIGQNTASQLNKHHINVAHISQFPDSEHMLELPCFKDVARQTIILFKGEEGRPVIEQTLLAKGAKLYSFSVYRRVLPTLNPQLSNSLWQNNAVDIILLTSAQSMHNLFNLFDKKAHGWLKNRRFLVISDRLAKIATELGIKKIKISHPNKIINTLLDYKD